MATQRLSTGRSSQFVDAAGISGAFAQQAEVIVSLVADSTYATSSRRYIPIAKNATEQYVQFQFRASKAGTVSVKLSYAMSVSEANAVVIKVSSSSVADAGNVDAALTAGASTTFTPGTGQTRKTFTLNTAVVVAEGDSVIIRLTRSNVAGDTHTGTFNVLEAMVTMD